MLSNKREKMRYTGLELFMGKLRDMIYSNNNPFINNHPSILSQRPQLKLLYEELDSVIQTPLFINEGHQHQQVITDLKKRFKDAAEDAHDIIDLFVYTINLGNQISLNQVSVPAASQLKIKMGGLFSGHCMPVRLTKSVKPKKITLKDVMRSIKSIKEEFITIHDKLRMDSSPRSDPMKTPSAAASGTSCSKSPLGMKKVHEDIVVGFDRHAERIRDKLVEDQKQLDVVSIVGMGGVGKTTLAKKIFNDPFVVYHFHIRGWVTVSQTYEKGDLLIRVLESIGIKPGTEDDYSQHRERLHKRLMGNRYLIVIDDIWSTKAWDDLKNFFPNNHTGSRILVTSRLKEVALHVKSYGFIQQLEYLTVEESWELLCKMVFHGNDCPKWLIKTGMEIARNCHGLPLTLVVVAGVLAKEALRKDSWERIGRSVSSYIVSGHMEYIEQLALSIDHLPGHLRDCFLYLGGFPEDHKFRVPNLIWLLMAEGFIQEDGHRSLEEIGEDCLMELVDRNLVIVATRKSNGGIKTFYIHDLLRELCLKIGKEESLCLKAERTMDSVAVYKRRRIRIKDDISITNAPMVRSLLCAYRYTNTGNLISMWSHFWMLLTVLDLGIEKLHSFPEEISQLVHLRYLAFCCDIYGSFPYRVFNLWNLRTLIIRGSLNPLMLPNTISKLVNLRHLKCNRLLVLHPSLRLLNLQTISRVLRIRAENLVKCFPCIKSLTCLIHPAIKFDIESLTFLENLKLRGLDVNSSPIPESQLKFQKNHIKFPASLKALTLRYYFPWSDMSIIQSLPNLEVLKVYDSFVGPRWDTGEEQFRRLKFLKLFNLEIEKWEASSINFPCLKQLVLKCCYHLEEIPSDIGYIPTLELIDIYRCGDSVLKSVDTIREEQHAQGNFELKIRV